MEITTNQHNAAPKEVELTFSSESTSNAIAASGKTPAAVMAAGQAMGGMRSSSLPFVPDTKPANKSRTLSPEEEAKLLEDSKWDPQVAAELKTKAELAGFEVQAKQTLSSNAKQIQELYKEVWQFLRNLWRRVTHLDDEKREELQPEEKAWMSEMEPLLKKIKFTEVHRDNFRIRFQEILTCTRANLNQRPKNPLKAALAMSPHNTGILGVTRNRPATPMQAGRVSGPPPIGVAPPPPPPNDPLAGPRRASLALGVQPQMSGNHSPLPSPMISSSMSSMSSVNASPRPALGQNKRAPSPLESQGKRTRLDAAEVGLSAWDAEATLCLICDLVDLVDAPAAVDQDRMFPEVLNFVRTAPGVRVAQTLTPITRQLSKFRPDQQAQIIDALQFAGFSIITPERPTIHSVSTSSRSSVMQHCSPTKKDTPWATTPTKSVPLAHAAAAPVYINQGLSPNAEGVSRLTSMTEYAAMRR